MSFLSRILLPLVLLFVPVSLCRGICPTDSVWESVSVGANSTVSCNTRFGVDYLAGFSHRPCVGTADNPSWGEEVSLCVYLPPSNISYPTGLIYRTGSTISITPTYSGYVEEWSISPPLPDYLSWDSQTGRISGTLVVAFERTYQITASNSDGTATVSWTLSVLNAGCPEEGPWPQTESEETASIPCTDNYRYVGSLLRRCEGYALPTWSAVIDNCTLGPPYALRYPQTTLVAYQNIRIDVLTPTYRGKGDQFFSQPSLPTGLLLDTSTGAISGKATGAVGCSSYLVGIRNEIGSSSTSLQICVLNGTEPSNWRITNHPKRWFWYSLSACVVVVTLMITVSVPCCLYRKRRSKTE